MKEYTHLEQVDGQWKVKHRKINVFANYDAFVSMPIILRCSEEDWNDWYNFFEDGIFEDIKQCVADHPEEYRTWKEKNEKEDLEDHQMTDLNSKDFKDFLDELLQVKYSFEHPLKPIQDILIEAAKVTDILFDGDSIKRDNWLLDKNSYFFNFSPLELILTNRGDRVLSFLKERAGL